MISRRHFLAGAASVAGGALAASAPDMAALAQGAGTVRIGQATSSLSFLPVWAARSLDSFKAQSLDLQWAAIPGGDPAALAALDSGDIDFAAVGSETALLAISKGQPFTFIYSLMPALSLELVVSGAFLEKAGVAPGDPLDKKLKALDGAVIGVSAINGAQDRAARWLAAKGGLDPKSSVRPVMVGGPPALEAALDNKRIDGFVLSPPAGALAEASKAGRILVKFADSFPELRRIHFLVLVAKTPLEGPRKELAIRTARALAAAGKAVVDDPKATADRIATRFFAKAPAGVIEAAVATMAPALAEGGGFQQSEIERLVAFASETGLDLGASLSSKTGEGAIWTNAIVEAAAHS